MYAGGSGAKALGAGNPEYTPIAESDFIYAVIGEELGFVGTALVLAFFLILFTARSADRPREPHPLRALAGQRADNGAGNPDHP